VTPAVPARPFCVGRLETIYTYTYRSEVKNVAWWDMECWNYATEERNLTLGLSCVLGGGGGGSHDVLVTACCSQEGSSVYCAVRTESVRISLISFIVKELKVVPLQA
jgi:hypothetical protein